MIRTRRYVVSVVVVLLLTVFSLVGVLILGARPKLGLDLQGGLSVVLTATGEEVDPGVLDQTVEIIRNRVDSLGAQEPDIARSGAENIIVQLPGIDDPDRALEVIGQTAQLRFREVLGTIDISAEAADAADEGLDPGTDDYHAFIADELGDETWEVSVEDPVDEEVVYPDAELPVWYRLGPADVTGEDIGDAYAQFDTTAGGWYVILDLQGDGVQEWADLTTRLSATQSQLAIVLDQVVESAPAVQQPITDGQAQITGQFSEPEARDLSLVLRTGSLPIELERSQVQRVSATLGTASLQAGLIAGAIGLVLVAMYMIFFYRVLGLITLLGLGVFGSLMLGLIGGISTYRGFSLTLAAVAGLIVSVGIAADSYIIYFERVKDEVRDGKTFRSAVDRAFGSALRTNLAANAVAFAAAIILYIVAVGPVRGFALMLGMSVAVDLGLMYFFAHPLIMLVARRRKTPSPQWVGLPPAQSSETAGVR